MAKNEQIIEEANYYIQNDVSVEEAAEHFGISRRSFQLYMAKLIEIAPQIAKLQQEKSLKMQEMRRGKYERTKDNSRRASWSLEDAERVAKFILSTNATIREAGDEFDIPKSTVHDMLSKGIPKDSPLREKLDELIETHNKDKTQPINSISVNGPKK